MTTFSVALRNLTVKAYLDKPLVPEEILISDGTGVLTVTLYPPIVPPTPSRFATDTVESNTTVIRPPSTRVRYHLQVDTGTRVNALRLGQLITFSGIDSDKKPLSTSTILETTSTGTPALFSDPPHIVPMQFDISSTSAKSL